MLIKSFTVGQLGTNCYIVTDPNTLECAVIDPGDEYTVILDYLEGQKVKCKAIMLTHGHLDHTMAAFELCINTGAEVYINKRDCSSEPGDTYSYCHEGNVTYYDEGDRVQVGSLEFDVMACPGHSPGSVVLKCQNVLFTGDVLFRDSCGRTDLPGGDMQILMKSLLRLYNLPGDFEVYPGHMDATTLDRERRFNYYMKYTINNQ